MQEHLKPVARNLKKEWLSLNMEKVGASKHQFGIILKGRFQTLDNKNITISALLTPGINADKHINLVMDIALPKVTELEPILPTLSAFMQQASATLSPMTIMVDMRTSQIVLRHNQLMSINHPPETTTFIKAAKILIPLLSQTVESLGRMNPAPADGRQMADMLAKSFYGVLQQ